MSIHVILKEPGSFVARMICNKCYAIMQEWPTRPDECHDDMTFVDHLCPTCHDAKFGKANLIHDGFSVGNLNCKASATIHDDPRRQDESRVLQPDPGKPYVARVRPDDVTQVIENCQAMLQARMNSDAKPPVPAAGTVLIDTLTLRLVSEGPSPDNPQNMLVTITFKSCIEWVEL